MSKREEIKVHITSHSTHRGLERSSTLNRRYVKRPTKVIVTDDANRFTDDVDRFSTIASKSASTKSFSSQKSPLIEFHKNRDFSDDRIAAYASPSISHLAPQKITSAPTTPRISSPNQTILPPAPNPYQSALDARKPQQQLAKAVSSRALKDAAINRALFEMEQNHHSKNLQEERIATRVMRSEMNADKKLGRNFRKSEKAVKHFKKNKAGRVLLAFATSSLCVIALAALVKINLPNLSVKVAAAQTGVEASYPNYVPRDFAIRDVYTNNSSVIIEFTGPDNKNFALAEEKSSWDSTALLTNYIKGAYGDSYDTVREQGITIYISHSNAAWVNNGIFYKLTANSGVLSKKQIISIVSSL